MTIKIDGFFIVLQDDPRCPGTGMSLGCMIVKFHCAPDYKYHYAKWTGQEDILDILPGKHMYLADSWAKAIEKIGFNPELHPEPQ
jgi:hypothetical protein